MLDVVQCPFCSSYLTQETLTYLEEKARGWNSYSAQVLADLGFDPIAIGRAYSTGIVAGWVANALSYADTAAIANMGLQRYTIQCLAHRIGYEQTVSNIELGYHKADLKAYLEERVQHEFRLLAADTGCQHWADYKRVIDAAKVQV